MFYNHDILTSRKHGVATIWLVATLGSKSTLKKVNRKAINEVNVPKACEVILTPEVPMALRLQSHLLYGVSRVYSQQCGYVLLDAQNIHTSMRQMLKSVRAMGNELDPQAGRTKPDLLLVQDDPAFVPDLAFNSMALNMDLPALDLSTMEEISPRDSSLFSPHARQSSHSDRSGSPGIRIPSSGSGPGGGLGDLGRFSLGDTSSINRSINREVGLLDPDQDELGFLPEVDFGFDTDGNLFEIERPASAARQDDVLGGPVRRGSDSAVIERVRREHEHAQQAALEGRDFDIKMDDLPPIDDDNAMLPDGEPFPERNRPSQSDKTDSTPTTRESNEGNEIESADAQMTRKPRATKVIPLDDTVQLRNSTIADWNSNYVDHMAKELTQKLQRAAPALAKKNADYWIWGSGIGDIGRDVALLGNFDPLGMFYGDKLRGRITGIKISIVGKKRGRNAVDRGATEEDEERRVRSRGESAEEVGRGQLELEYGGNDDGYMAVGDDEDPEVGRTAPTPLAGELSHEASSVMPWNLSASQRSSTLQQGRRAGILSNANSVTGDDLQYLGGRRPLSASPLVGRGSALPHRLSTTIDPSGLMQETAQSSALGADEAASGIGGDDGFEMPDSGGINLPEDFELFGPSAFVDTQTAAQSQWIRNTLDNESVNFLAFVTTACMQEAEHGESETQKAPVEFETLLPPKSNSRMVAAQGLLHCLSLATKRLLKVSQAEAFGPIMLSLVT